MEFIWCAILHIIISIFSTEEMTKSFGWEGNEQNLQQDIQEAFRFCIVFYFYFLRILFKILFKRDLFDFFIHFIQKSSFRLFGASSFRNFNA